MYVGLYIFENEPCHPELQLIILETLIKLNLIWNSCLIPYYEWSFSLLLYIDIFLIINLLNSAVLNCMFHIIHYISIYVVQQD